jgi:flavin-binding protein dodecin
MGRRGSGGDQDGSRDNPRSSGVKQDIHLDEGGAITYRTKLQLSFKCEREH